MGLGALSNERPYRDRITVDKSVNRVRAKISAGFSASWPLRPIPAERAVGVTVTSAARIAVAYSQGR